MNHKLMEKAKENYIKEGYQRLANIEATRKWGKTPQVELPKFDKTKVVKNRLGWFMILKELKP